MTESETEPPSSGMQPRYYRDYHYPKRLLPNRYVRELEEGVENIDQAIERTGYTVGYPGWNLLYYTCYCNLKENGFNAVVETGTNRGFSTIFLAQALIDRRRQGHVYTVELDESNCVMARRNFENAKVADRITLYQGDSIELLERIARSVDSIRFAFLDGNHNREHVVREFAVVHPKLEDKAIVFFDNTDFIGQPEDDLRVFGALRDIQDRFGGNIVRFPFVSWYTPGQAIWQA